MTTAPKTAISTAEAPAPAPVFSQGVRRGPMLQVSARARSIRGQGPICTPATSPGRPLAPSPTSRPCWSRAERRFEDVIMLRVYLTTRDDFAAMNEAYGDFLAGRCQVLPARTTVFVGLPREEMLVEIDALAVLGD